MIDWIQLEKEVKALSTELSIVTRERNNTSRHYNSLLQEKSTLKNKYNSILKEAKEKKKNLLNLHRKLITVRNEWINAGGTLDDFCLDVEGYKLQLEFNSLKSKDLSYIKEEPEKIKSLHDSKEKTCNKVLGLIKIYDDKIKLLNRKLSSLHLYEEVKEYIHLDNNLRNSGEIFVEVQVNQLSVRKRRMYFGHKRYYVRQDGIWYRTFDDKSSKKIPLSDDENNKLFKLINKYL